MQTFSIRDIENLTGVKAHTLRIWEQRYNFFQPKRKESQHRFYDNEDLKKLLRVSYLYHNGWKISKIAAMPEKAIEETIANADVAEGENRRFVALMIEAALDFNEARIIKLMNEVIEKTGFEACITEVCYPYLQKIGLLWSTNNVIPAQEHFSSYIIQNRIIVETDRLPLPDKPADVMLICPEGEFHELPLLFINYLLRKNGRSTVYLGSNIQKNEVMAVAKVSGINYLYLHLITNFTGMYADDYLEEICRSVPEKNILASGEGIRNVQRSFVNLTLLKTDQQIRNFINGL
jgi:DNA-binding transcriptional MerR regulator